MLWNGAYYVRPQAGSRIDSSALNAVQLGSANKVCIIGEMTGLVVPKTLKQIDSTLANALLAPSSEEARLAAQLVFNPSPGTAGATEVYLLPVNPATAATLTLSGSIRLDTFIYGLVANQLKVKLENGTNTGKKLTVVFQDQTEVHDDITKSTFQIQYIGTGSACTLTITPTAAAHILSTEATGAAGDNLAINLNTYNTIQALVDAIVATGKYTVTMLTGSPKKDLSMKLDGVAAQDIKTAAYTVKSDLQAIVDRVKDRSAYLSPTRVADASAIPTNCAWTYLTGAADGDTQNSDWQAAFDLLKSVNMQILVPLTSSPSIHAMGSAHCTYMSGPLGKSERRQFVGGALQNWASEVARGTAIQAINDAIKLLNDDRTVHVGLGCKQYDPDGETKLYPAYITACMYAGIAGGAKVVTPLTRKYLNCLGLEVELRGPEIDQLLEGHCAVPIPDLVQEAGFVISRQLTTWAQDVDLYRIEFSVGRGADYVAKEVRNRHELEVGKGGTPGIEGTIINITNAVLKAAFDDEIITFYDPKATALRADGLVRYVDYSARPVLPINWIFSTYHLLPTRFSIGL
ncbi:MAG TPA: hypothetical protein DCS05_06595 [Nitrospiraceae bacterium]|nr:hypothetical protein [Nitrospiraceae bacterium]